MIRLFKVYYPLRTLVLLAGEALIVWVSFVLGTMWRNPDSWLLLNVEGGYLKILAVTVAVLLLSHWLDLYDSSSLNKNWEQSLRILLVLGFVALALSAVGFLFPDFLPGNGSALFGLIILTCTLFCWRGAYGWMVKQPFLRERVYVLGTGERAERLVDGLRQRSTMGIEVVGWTGDVAGELTRESVASHLLALARGQGVHRVIVAMPDRRGTLPVEELLDLRLAGVKVEEATSWLEKISGRIEVDQLYPSWLIFAEGFRFSNFFRCGAPVAEFSGGIGCFCDFTAVDSIYCSGRQAWIRPVRFFTGSSGWDGGEKFSIATNSAPCVRMRKPIPAPHGLPMMIRESRRLGNSSAPRGSMRFPSYGVC